METEKRARIQDKEAAKKILFSLGAEFVSAKEQRDEYFGSIELYKKLGYSFLARIRRSGKDCFFAVKTAKPKKDGVWEEFEERIEKPEEFAKMLAEMGLEKIISVRKKREEFRLGELSINIDDFKERGTFIELEIVSEKDSREKILEAMKKLGIKETDIIDRGYITIFLKEEGSKFSEYIKN